MSAVKRFNMLAATMVTIVGFAVGGGGGGIRGSADHCYPNKHADQRYGGRILFGEY
jgi:hypothetical protein